MIYFLLEYKKINLILYRDEIHSLQILLSRTQGRPCRTVKQEQEEISPNHVQKLKLKSVHFKPWKELSSVKGTDIHSMLGMKYVNPSTHVSPRMHSKEKEPGNEQGDVKLLKFSTLSQAGVPI